MGMEDESNTKVNCGCSKINWGTVIAGAAVVTGAVLLASAVDWSAVKAPEAGSFSMPESIKKLGGSLVTGLQKLVEGAQSQAIVGAALVGGGLGFALLRDNKCEMAEAYVNAAMNTHAGREESRTEVKAIQALMQARAQKFQQLGIPMDPSAGRAMG